MKFIQILALLLLSTPGMCQITAKTSQRFDFRGAETAQKRSSGPALFLSRFSGNEILSLQRDPSFIKSLPDDVYVLSMTDMGDVIVVKSDTGEQELTVYENSRGSANVKYARRFKGVVCFTPFPNGAFLTIDCDEEPGQKIEFYGSNLSAVSSFTPYASGYVAVLSSIGTADVLLHPIPAIPDAAGALYLVSQRGQIIFKKDIPAGQRIGSVLCAEPRYAISSWAPGLGHQISVFDRSGRLMWARGIEDEIKNWRFSEGSKPVLIAATQKRIYILDASQGNSINEMDLPDLYKKAGVNRARKDNYFETLGIEPVKDQPFFELLVAEPWGEDEYLNVLLCAINPRSSELLQVIKIGNASSKPLLRSSRNQVLLIIGDDILSYEY